MTSPDRQVGYHVEYQGVALVTSHYNVCSDGGCGVDVLPAVRFPSGPDHAP